MANAENWLRHAKRHAQQSAGAMEIMIRDGSPEAQEAQLGIALCQLDAATKYLKPAAGEMPEPRPHWAEQDEPKWADDSRVFKLQVCQTCGKEHVVCRCNSDYAREQAEYDNIDVGGK